MYTGTEKNNIQETIQPNVIRDIVVSKKGCRDDDEETSQSTEPRRSAKNLAKDSRVCLITRASIFLEGDCEKIDDHMMMHCNTGAPGAEFMVNGDAQGR